MQAKHLAFAGIAALALATVCIVAVSERGARSPSVLLEGGQKLYPYQYYYPYQQYPYQPDPYGYGSYGGYPYGGYPYGGYPYYPYPQGGGTDGEAYRQWAAYAQQQQYADYVNQAQAADYASQQAYINQVNAYNQYAAAAQAAQASKAVPSGLKVAKAPSLVYMGDLEMGGYAHEITGGNDGGYNAPFDLNGDGQYVDNWGKVATQWKHKKGSAQLKKAGGKAQQKQSQLKQVASSKASKASKADKQEFQLEQRKLFALAEANKLHLLSQARPIQALGAMDQPDDYYWQKGFGSGHPGAIPNEQAPFRPWYWKLTYDKFGHLVG